MYSRLNDTNSLLQNEKFLEYSQQQKPENKTLKSRHGCYSNKKFQERTKLDRNENEFGSRFSTANNALKRNNFVNFTNTIQSVNSIQKKGVKHRGDGERKGKEENSTDWRMQDARGC